MTSDGLRRIRWAESNMPTMQMISARLSAGGGLAGYRVGIAIHITSETAALARAIQHAGAQEVAVCSSNPSTSNTAVVEALRESGIIVFNKLATSMEEHEANFDAMLDFDPHFVIDDGAEIITRINSIMLDGTHRAILGALEETTSGITRIASEIDSDDYGFPIVNVNHARTKHFFDNHYGTGQSVFDAIFRTGNRLIAGSRVTVIGYGRCGSGIAKVARGLGANVTVFDPDPIAALSAHYDGHVVAASAPDAASGANIIISAAGQDGAVSEAVLEEAADGTLVVNSGHFREEIEMSYLETFGRRIDPLRSGVSRFRLGEKVVSVLADGNVANLAEAEGNPATLMDLSFSAQLSGLAWIAQNCGLLPYTLHKFPEELDNSIARDKLSCEGVWPDSDKE